MFMGHLGLYLILSPLYTPSIISLYMYMYLYIVPIDSPFHKHLGPPTRGAPKVRVLRVASRLHLQQVQQRGTEVGADRGAQVVASVSVSPGAHRHPNKPGLRLRGQLYHDMDIYQIAWFLHCGYLV